MSTFYNRTRQAPSIPRKLMREKKWHLLPVYYILRTSTLAREGIEHSGSYRFADHLYARQAEGRFLVGALLDRLLLSFPSARSFHSRYALSKEEIHAYLNHSTDEEIHVLSVPSGLARELFEVSAERGQSGSGVYYHGIDLDPLLISQVNERAKDMDMIDFWEGDVLDSGAYKLSYNIILSLGLGEFLDDDLLSRFYGLVLDQLAPNGVFITSGMTAHRLTDYLLRNLGELHTYYRTEDQLRELARRAGFQSIRTYHDSHGYQTMMICQKEVS